MLILTKPNLIECQIFDFWWISKKRISILTPEFSISGQCQHQLSFPEFEKQNWPGKGKPELRRVFELETIFLKSFNRRSANFFATKGSAGVEKKTLQISWTPWRFLKFQPGPDPIKLILCVIYSTLNFWTIREPKTGHTTALIGWNFSVA